MSGNYKIIDGFKCYAPDLAIQNDGFPPDMFDLLASLEERNFWFKARNKILIHLFEKFLGKNAPEKRVLEIGCGNGFVLKGLKPLGYELVGSEIYLEGLKNVKKRLPEIEIIQMDALDIPFVETFDAIGAFDVIEHITDDEKVLQNIYKALKPGGYCFITVPQYKWMWSYLDDYARHKRRYSQKELKQKIKEAGFEISFISSFVTILFPFVVLSRLMKKIKPPEQVTIEDMIQEFKIPEGLNKLFYRGMMIDTWCIKHNISLPFGNSIVVVAKKPIKIF